MKINTIYIEDCQTGLKKIPDKSVNCCVTSPPYYGLRDYGIEEQIGLEKTPEQYVEKLVTIFREVRRVLKDDGTLWLNLGDSYAGAGWRNNNDNPGYKQTTNKGTNISGIKIKTECKPKDLIGIPWMVAFALRVDGWYLRQDIIWHKPNPMPESVTDRCTKAHEYIFLLSKSQRYYYDTEAIREKANYDGRKDTVMKGSQKYNTSVVPNQAAHTFAVNGHERWKQDENGMHVRNRRSVWTVNTKPFKEAHFAVFPPKLIEPCIKAGCPEGGIVLDPFMGAGTTAVVARMLNRNFIGFELNKEYVEMANKRLYKELGMFL
jgi:DNA modification methylase